MTPWRSTLPPGNGNRAMSTRQFQPHKVAFTRLAAAGEAQRRLDQAMRVQAALRGRRADPDGLERSLLRRPPSRSRAGQEALQRPDGRPAGQVPKAALFAGRSWRARTSATRLQEPSRRTLLSCNLLIASPPEIVDQPEGPSAGACPHGPHVAAVRARGVALFFCRSEHES